MCHNVRFAHVNVRTVCDEAKVFVQQDYRSSIGMNRTIQTIDVNLLYFYALEINILYGNVCIL